MALHNEVHILTIVQAAIHTVVHIRHRATIHPAHHILIRIIHPPISQPEVIHLRTHRHIIQQAGIVRQHHIHHLHMFHHTVLPLLQEQHAIHTAELSEAAKHVMIL